MYVGSLRRFLITDPIIDKLEDYNNFLIKVNVKKRCSHYYTVLKTYIEFKIDGASLKNQLIDGLIQVKDRDPIISRRYLNDEQRIEVINNMVSTKHQLIALLQSVTGARIGDVLRLKRGAIYYEKYNGEDVLRLDVIGKGNKKTPVYIFDEVIKQLLREFLDEYYLDEEYYFIDGRDKSKTGNDFNLRQMNYSRYWGDLKQALHKCGIKQSDFSTHDFRRCFAREVWTKYKDPLILQRALNHNDPKTTFRYLRLTGLNNIDVMQEMQNQ